MSETATTPRPVPLADQDSRLYWEAANRGTLLVQRCNACGKAQFYFRSLCHHCQSEDLGTEPSKGLGSVASFSIVYRPPMACFKPDLPYVVALVDVDEGFRFMTNIVNCDPASVHIGQRVRVLFQRIDGSEQMLPKMEPL